jgi:hypothetical protein
MNVLAGFLFGFGAGILFTLFIMILKTIIKKEKSNVNKQI